MTPDTLWCIPGAVFLVFLLIALIVIFRSGGKAAAPVPVAAPAQKLAYQSPQVHVDPGELTDCSGGYGCGYVNLYNGVRITQAAYDALRQENEWAAHEAMIGDNHHPLGQPAALPAPPRYTPRHEPEALPEPTTPVWVTGVGAHEHARRK